MERRSSEERVLAGEEMPDCHDKRELLGRE